MFLNFPCWKVGFRDENKLDKVCVALSVIRVLNVKCSELNVSGSSAVLCGLQLCCISQECNYTQGEKNEKWTIFLNKEVVTKQNLSEFGVRYVSSGDFISCSLFIST